MIESTIIEWNENGTDSCNECVGRPLTEVEINNAIKHIKEKAKESYAFSGKARPRLYRWLRDTLRNCHMEEYTRDGGISYYVIGHDKMAVKDYIKLM